MAKIDTRPGATHRASLDLQNMSKVELRFNGSGMTVTESGMRRTIFANSSTMMRAAAGVAGVSAVLVALDLQQRIDNTAPRRVTLAQRLRVPVYAVGGTLLCLGAFLDKPRVMTTGATLVALPTVTQLLQPTLEQAWYAVVGRPEKESDPMELSILTPANTSG